MRRPLNGFEKLVHLNPHAAPMNFALMARLRGQVAADRLQASLAHLHPRYPLATLRLEQDEQARYFFTTEQVPVFPLRVLPRSSAEAWRRVAATELGTAFDAKTGPQVRAVLLADEHGADLVLVFDHTVCDGMAGVIFLRDLLRLLGEPQAVLPALPQPAALLHLIPATVKAAPALRWQRWVIKTLLRVTQLTARRKPTGGTPQPALAFCVLSQQLTAPQTAALVARCRQEGTSVHGAVCVAWLQARATLVPKKRQNWRRTVASPIDLRGHFNTGAAFGVYVTNLETTINCQPRRPFWEMAREFKRQLQTAARGPQLFGWVLAIAAATEDITEPGLAALGNLAARPVAYDYSITNLGRLPLPNQFGPHYLEAVYGPIVNVSEQEQTVGVATANEQLTFTFTFRDFVLAPPLAEKIMAEAVAILEKAVGW